MQTNMPWAVYRCDRLTYDAPFPQNQVLVAGHLTPREAMDDANARKRADPQHSYLVGSA